MRGSHGWLAEEGEVVKKPKARLDAWAEAQKRFHLSDLGGVSNVEMAALMALIYKALFPSISTFETPPSGGIWYFSDGTTRS